MPPLAGGNEQETRVHNFDYVIVSTGMNNAPLQPTEEMFPGLLSFPGTTLHVSGYKEPPQFRGKRVLVVGGSFSGCEAASEMAAAPKGTGPTRVVVSTRSMRHMCVKQKNERVMLAELNARFYYLQKLAGKLWDEDMCADMLKLVWGYSKNEDVNLPPANGPIKLPGIPNWLPVNQKVIDASMSGALEWNIGGVCEMNGDGTVKFADGTTGEFDVVIFSTGYQFDLPFLDDDTLKKVLADELPGHLLDLANFSFHPELRRLAFVGMFALGGSSFPVFDSQARWIAKVIADPDSRPSNEELWARVKEYRQVRIAETAHVLLFPWEVLDRFAELGGFDVDLSVHNEWTKALIFGPLVPAQFRLFGEGKKDKLMKIPVDCEGGSEVDTFEEFERQMMAAGFVKGDNKVEPDILRRLVEVCDILTKQGKALTGLKEAVDYLVQVNRS